MDLDFVKVKPIFRIMDSYLASNFLGSGHSIKNLFHVKK